MALLGATLWGKADTDRMMNVSNKVKYLEKHKVLLLDGYLYDSILMTEGAYFKGQIRNLLILIEEMC